MLMQRRIFRAVLTDLANTEPDRFIRHGKINASELSRALKVSQATISRAMTNARYEPTATLIDQICRYFGISAAQARGEETLTGDPRAATAPFSARARALAEQFDRLPAARKKAVEVMVAAFDDDAANRQSA